MVAPNILRDGAIHDRNGGIERRNQAEQGEQRQLDARDTGGVESR